MAGKSDLLNLGYITKFGLTFNASSSLNDF